MYVSDVVTNVIGNLMDKKPIGMDIFRPKSSWLDYGAAALSGAFAAGSAGRVGQTLFNAFLSGMTYIADAKDEVSVGGLLLSVSAGALSGFGGGDGVNGQRLRNVWKYSDDVIKNTVSPKKASQYAYKKVRCLVDAGRGIRNFVAVGTGVSAGKYVLSSVYRRACM